MQTSMVSLFIESDNNTFFQLGLIFILPFLLLLGVYELFSLMKTRKK